MADIADLASDREEMDRARALAAARRAVPQWPAACGTCHNCGEPIEAAAFCDVDCRDDWQRRTRRNPLPPVMTVSARKRSQFTSADQTVTERGSSHDKAREGTQSRDFLVDSEGRGY